MSEYNPAEDKKRQLKWNEHIRKRPGMYVGNVSVRGFMDMLKGAISSTVTTTGTKLLSLELDNNLKVKVGFNNCNGEIQNIWGHWEKHPLYQLQFELSVLNALSKSFKITFSDSTNRLISAQSFEAGDLIEDKKSPVIDFSRCEIDFVLDNSNWGEDFAWNTAYISHELREYAYLFKDVRFDLSCIVKQEEYKFAYHFQNGLKDRISVETLNGLGGSYFETQVKEKIDDFTLEAAFAFREYSVDPPFLRSYVNNYMTPQHGTHVEGLLIGLTKAINDYVLKKETPNGSSILEKTVKNNLVAVVNMEVNNPIYSGAVKHRLANPEIINPIANCVAELLLEKFETDEKTAKQLIKFLNQQDWV